MSNDLITLITHLHIHTQDQICVCCRQWQHLTDKSYICVSIMLPCSVFMIVLNKFRRNRTIVWLCIHHMLVILDTCKQCNSRSVTLANQPFVINQSINHQSVKFYSALVTKLLASTTDHGNDYSDNSFRCSNMFRLITVVQNLAKLQIRGLATGKAWLVNNWRESTRHLVSQL